MQYPVVGTSRRQFVASGLRLATTLQLQRGVECACGMQVCVAGAWRAEHERYCPKKVF